MASIRGGTYISKAMTIEREKKMTMLLMTARIASFAWLGMTDKTDDKVVVATARSSIHLEILQFSVENDGQG